MKLPLVFAPVAALAALAGCSGSYVLPAVETTNATDAGLDANAPDADVCTSAAPIADTSALPTIGSCVGPLTRTLNGCAEWHAAGPYDFGWKAHHDCAASTGWTWRDGGCPRMGPGGYCAWPYDGPVTGCVMTEWDYFYSDSSAGAVEVTAESDACLRYGGTWTPL